MNRCIVFDFDGTLIDSNRIKKQTFYDILDERWDSSYLDEIFALDNPGDRYSILHKFVELNFRRQSVVIFQDEIERYAAQLVDAYTQQCEYQLSLCSEIPGATAALTKLKAQGHMIFINSATPDDSLLRVITARNLDHLFDGVFGSTSSKYENLSKILKLTKTTSEQLIMVGDDIGDLQAANQIGCKFIGVAREDNNLPVNLVFKVEDLTELYFCISHLYGCDLNVALDA